MNTEKCCAAFFQWKEIIFQSTFGKRIFQIFLDNENTLIGLAWEWKEEARSHCVSDAILSSLEP